MTQSTVDRFVFANRKWRRSPRATVHLLFKIAAPLFLRTKDPHVGLADALDWLLCTQTQPSPRALTTLRQAGNCDVLAITHQYRPAGCEQFRGGNAVLCQLQAQVQQ